MTKCPKCGAAISREESPYGEGLLSICTGCRVRYQNCECKATMPEPFARKLKLTRASDIEIKPVVWAWKENGRGRIPSGALAAAAGREGTGKSSFGIWMTAEITTGMLPGSFLGTAHNVIYAAIEDSWEHTIAGRLKAAGANLSRVFRIDVEVSEDETSIINLPTDFDLLEQAIIENDVKLVILDPLISTISSVVDTHKERSVRTVLDPLARMADRTGCVMLGICHFGKGAGTDASSLITGSGAFKNVPRAIFGFAVDAENEVRVMTQTKNSLGRSDHPSLAYRIDEASVLTSTGEIAEVGRFVFDGISDRSVEDVLSSNGVDREDQDAKTDAKDYLRKALDNRWRRSNEIKEEAREMYGITSRTLERARKEMKIAAKQFATDPRGKNEWWITLPEQVGTATEPPPTQTATETDSKGQTAKTYEQTAIGDGSTRPDSQTANQGDAVEDWRSGGLPPEEDPVSLSPNPPERPVRRKCGHCKKAIPKGARKDAKWCSTSCAQKNYKLRAKTRNQENPS
ncbi:AAA family ATPase [Nonomuraea sp. NPDC051941]|uniref:AAA family ATPase n=1 Tax=Nonomuraea sp. NPDC051941 TaxID=3364373 RepID=UPI0037CB34E7